MEILALLSFILVVIIGVRSSNAIGSLQYKVEKQSKELESIYKILDALKGKKLVVKDEKSEVVSSSVAEPIINTPAEEVGIDALDQALLGKKLPTVERPKVKITQPPKESQPDMFDHIRGRFIQDRPLKLGAGLLLIGMAWFVTYAFINDWVAPSVRIILGCLLGVITLYFGRTTTEKDKEKGSIVVGLGLGIYLLCLVAARYYFDLINPTVSLVLMVLMIGVVGWMSVARNYQPLAIIALLFGSAVPFLTLGGFEDATMLLVYYFILSFGAVVVSLLQGWKGLYSTSIFLFLLYSLFFYAHSAGNVEQIDLYIAFLFAGMYMATNVMHIIQDGKVSLLGFTGSVVNAGTILIWLLSWTNFPEYSLYLFIIALMCFGACLYIYQQQKENEGILQYLLFGVVFLALGLATVLQGETLLIAYIILSAVLIGGSIFWRKSSDYAHYTQRTFILPFFMAAMYGINQLSGLASVSSPELVWITYSVATGGVAYLLNKYNASEGENEYLPFWLTLAAAGMFMLTYTLVGIENFAPVAFLLILVLMIYLASKHPGMKFPKRMFLLNLVPLSVVLLNLSNDWNELGLIVAGVALLFSALYYSINLEENNEDTTVTDVLAHTSLGVGIVGLLTLANTDFFSLLSICGVVGVFVLFLFIGNQKKYGYLIWAIPGILYSLPGVIFSQDRSSGIVHAASISMLGILVALYALYVFTDGKEDGGNDFVKESSLALGCAYIFISIWLVTHGLLDNGMANFISLALYTIAGLRAYVTGKEKNKETRKYIGTIILIGVCLRLILVDMSQMEIIWRIITFILIGFMFIASGFIGKKK